MGRGPGEFVCLPLCKKGSVAFSGDYMGRVSGPSIQSASDSNCFALCRDVRADGGGDGEYVQEIPVEVMQTGGGIPGGTLP